MLPVFVWCDPNFAALVGAAYTGRRKMGSRAMTLAGLIVCAAGVLGVRANYCGLYPMTGVMGDLRLWGGAAVIGAVTALLTRRASD